MLEAKEHSIEIWSYTDDKWGAAQADRYVEGLESCFASLDELPSHGCRELVPETQSDVRFYRYRSHHDFFRRVPDRVEILTIIHAGRQAAIERFLSE
jgi:plasmid stabilization system protein ParE